MARIAATCDFARPKTFRVGRPDTRSRKCPDSSPSVRHCRSTCDFVYMPMSTMNTGMSGRVTAMMSVESRSWPRIVSSTATGTITASTSCGRYRA